MRFEMSRLNYYAYVNAKWSIDTLKPCSYEFEMNAYSFAIRVGIVYG